MFGHVAANVNDLSPEEKERYHAVYCGLCHTLGERHGFRARLGLTYDLAFLALLLSSLYEPEETAGESRCLAHPRKKHAYAANSCTDYAADMTVALTYYKCLDDWQDDHSLPRKGYAGLLSGAYCNVKAQWPEQCAAIETGIAELSRIEGAKEPSPDAGANCFGRLMAGIFLYRRDRWAEQLARLGYGLGRYIYLADAAVDYDRDLKKGNYNPLHSLAMRPEELAPTLKTVLGEASAAFEILPLVQDANLLRNILYSGIWQKYNRAMQTEGKET